jgi:predicted enzyme related to lactoylglutathione lyase
MMSEVTEHTPSTAAWLDLASPDFEASARFYGQLFGWETERVAGPEMGNYTFFKLRGKNVGGLASLMTPDQPIVWSIYFASSNVDQTAKQVSAAGGSVLMPPDDIMDNGRIGFFSDSAGAAFGIWQPKAHKGVDLINEPGAFAWAELQTRDAAAVAPFYQHVFGWGSKNSSMGPGMPEYTEWQLGGQSIAGAMPMSPDMPAQVPAHWMPYFQVENADSAAEQVGRLSGKIMVGPMDFPGGRFAVVSDPQGGVFGILETKS